MIRVTKLADYGVLLMTWFAWRQAQATEPVRRTAPALSAETGLPAPTVSKLLRMLAKADLLDSQRGATGGYSLAHRPREISMAQIIVAIEGPIALTECLSDDDTPDCEVESICPTRTNWDRINHAIRGALEGISLDEMAQPQRGWRARMSRTLAGTETPS